MDEAQIISALEAGAVTETHQLEIKRDAPMTKAERSEIARDLASMALDGGAFLFGVEEVKEDQTFRPSPVDLAGRVEALEQIAELRIDPPLTIRVREIVSSADTSKGYLHVSVDASPLAPHMVDGVYYGRGEKRRRRLGDAEVLRLHRNRVADQQPVLAMMEADIKSDPTPPDQRRLGHLFVVARPVTGAPSMAEDWVWAREALFEVFQSSSRALPEKIVGVAPRPGVAHRLEARTHGQAWTSLDPERPTPEGSTVDVEFREDGSVHVFVGRLTELPRNEGGEKLLLDALAVAYVMRTMSWAMSVAERSEYPGSWDLAVSGVGIKGTVALSNSSDPFLYDGTVYPAVTYLATTRATRAEMQENPGVVTGRLLSRFVRSMRLGRHYGELFGWPR